ncbi:MAG TPA: glycosyltransferase [Vicinamibacterales bacterium]|nr:glycosyltransferase [Vicinamibacterales bacterium]
MVSSEPSLTPPGGRIRVLALSPIPEEGAGCRFRISQYIPYLQSQGFDVTVRSFYTPRFFRLVYQRGRYLRKAASFIGLTLRQLAILPRLNQYDLVFLYREIIPLGPPILELAIAKRQSPPLVYDFDDAIFLPAVSDANKAILFLKDTSKAAAIVRHSRRVTVGNAYLAEFARAYNPAVEVVPTAVDTTKFVPRAAASRSDEPPVIGWIGSPTTFAYLEGLTPVLRKLATRRRFVLKVSGAGRPVSFPGLEVADVPWSLAHEVELFNTCDIGVYPLTDDAWSRGKCGFKAIQFMACGVPVVAAAVGVNREIVQDGINGFLASTPEEWVEKLDRLLTDEALRARMRLAARRTIEERYSIQVTGPRLVDVFNEALGIQHSDVNSRSSKRVASGF